MILSKTKQAFKLTKDLAEKLDNNLLIQKLPNLKSNKIGEQFWCVIGARESFLKAMKHSEWQGFSCSIKNSFSKLEILEKLKKTQLQIEMFDIELNKKQEEILLNLYTHEIQHHGQLIRYCYALGIDFPKSWNKAYTV